MQITFNYDKNFVLAILPIRDLMENDLIVELSTRVKEGIYSTTPPPKFGPENL